MSPVSACTHADMCKQQISQHLCRLLQQPFIIKRPFCEEQGTDCKASLLYCKSSSLTTIELSPPQQPPIDPAPNPSRKKPPTPSQSPQQSPIRYSRQQATTRQSFTFSALGAESICHQPCRPCCHHSNPHPALLLLPGTCSGVSGMLWRADQVRAA